MARAPKRPATSTSTDDDDDLPRPFRPSAPATPSHRLGAARSCEGCHQRKIRCDRGVPCTNCAKHHMTCVYPTKNPDAARKTPPTLQDITNRLERLEALLSRLAKGSELGAGPASDGGHGRGHGPSESRPENQIQARPAAHIDAATPTAHPHSSGGTPQKSTWELLLNNSNIEPLLHDPSASETAASNLNVHTTTTHNKLPAQPGAYAPLDLYPDPQLALQLWNIYVKSVDPVLKILHIPTVQSTVVATILDPRSAQPSTVALTFAIYYAAVTSLCHDNGRTSVDLPSEKPVLLKRYQTALDRLLITPDLMGRPDVTGLQALAIYVTCLRAHELGRRVWVLNGLAIRLAQSISLHRDGTSLKLSPFETEMRLRLWWHLCVLDSRAPEDQGFQPAVDLINQELRLPLNVNDDQIYPDMTHFPQESHGWTEMSFFRIQTDSCRLMHPILDMQLQPAADSADVLSYIRQKRKLIQNPGPYMAENYGISLLSLSTLPPLSPGSGTALLLRIATQHVMTACKKLEFVLQLREEICLRKLREVAAATTGTTVTTGTTGTTGTTRQAGPGEGDEAEDVRKPSFQLACDTLESSHALLREERGLASRFQWFFSMYTQWYALAYVLRCLCNTRRPCGREADRAWVMVDRVFPRGTSRLPGGPYSAAATAATAAAAAAEAPTAAAGYDEHGHGRIWKYLSLLRHQAWSLRQQHAQRSEAPAMAAEMGIPPQPPSHSGKVDSIVSFQFFGEAEAPPPPLQPSLPPLPTSSTNNMADTTDHGSSMLPEWSSELMTGSNPDQSVFASLDLLMPEIPFLPDWNAVINGE